MDLKKYLIIINTVIVLSVLLYLLFLEKIEYNFFLVIPLVIVNYKITVRIIIALKELLLKADMFGMDINKRGTPLGEKKVPESLGLASLIAFVICCILLIAISKNKELNYNYLIIILSVTLTGFLVI